MELPKGIKVVSDASIPKGEARLVQDGKVVGKITNISCPVVEQYKRHGRATTLKRPDPGFCDGIVYNENIQLKELERFWILSAVKKAGGSITRAARTLGMARETLYRKVREYNETK